MTTPIGLHPIIYFTTEADFSTNILTVQKSNYPVIWLKGEFELVKKHSIFINTELKAAKIKLIADKSLIESGINAWGIMTDESDTVAEFQKSHPKQKIIGLADDIATAKNFELAQAAIVYLGPIDAIGEEPYITLIPETPDYEWQFIDITIPVCAFGDIQPIALEKFCKKVNLNGFAVEKNSLTDFERKKLRFAEN